MITMRVIVMLLLVMSSSKPYADTFLSAAQLGLQRYSGFNVGEGYLSGGDIEALSLSGAKIVRVLLVAEKCKMCRGYSLSREKILNLDRVVRLSEQNDVRVIVSLDTKPAREQANFWKDEYLKRSLVKIWISLAERYAGNTVIAAYDLINEPTVEVSQSPQAEEVWRLYAELIVDEIRRVDKNHAIVVQPTPLALPGAFNEMKPLRHGNVLYSFHFYEPHQVTHQGLFGFPLNQAYPGEVPRRGYWDKRRLNEYMAFVRRFQMKYDVPIQVGEFSCIRWAEPETRANYLRDVLALFDEYKWPWLYHSFREWGGWDAEISGNERKSQLRDASNPIFFDISARLKSM